MIDRMVSQIEILAVTPHAKPSSVRNVRITPKLKWMDLKYLNADLWLNEEETRENEFYMALL